MVRGPPEVLPGRSSGAGGKTLLGEMMDEFQNERWFSGEMMFR